MSITNCVRFELYVDNLGGGVKLKRNYMEVGEQEKVEYHWFRAQSSCNFTYCSDMSKVWSSGQCSAFTPCVLSVATAVSMHQDG
jgi:hypothetical protein